MFPYAWFWQAADGRVFDSARVVVVDSADAAFLAWCADGFRPSRWPDAGQGQTNAALKATLAPYGIWQDPVAPAPVPVITYKADLIRRATDDEVDAFEAALAAASSKLRRLYLDITHIDHNAAEFPVLHDAIQDALEAIMPADQAAVRTTLLLMPSETEA